MSSRSFAIVDLETTGVSPTGDRITEVAVMRIKEGEVFDEWSTLVNPEMSIPPAVQALTGISNEMVRGAPHFSEIARELHDRLEGTVFVAHNARFDYGFLKNEYRRLGFCFQAPVLCTVRLSRLLYPQARGHGLDAIACRHGLEVIDRHRAMGDVRLVWQFLCHARDELGSAALEAGAEKLLKTPSLPPQLPREALDDLPEGPGVYLFYGLNGLPIYVGKSVNLRDRVRSHFSGDHRSGKDLTLSTAVHRITFEETCGELGALLREARLVKELSPLYNRQLRRREKEVSLLLDAEGGHLVWLEGQEFEDSSANDRFGPFPSRVKARAVLAALAAEHQLCWKLLGLEKREGACFARQLRKCRGACCGEESVASHHLRLAQALLPYRLKPWPFRGAAGVREIHPDSGRECIEVFDHWRHLGSARDDTALHALLGAGPPPQFDFDVYRILERHLRSAANRRGVIDFAAIAPPY